MDTGMNGVFCEENSVLCGGNRVNAPVNEHLRIVNEHCYKIMFAARLIQRVAKIVWI